MKKKSKSTFHVFRFGKAFTLIELMVVIAIIAVLMGLLMPAFSRVKETARHARTQALITSVATAIKAYYSEYGTWPDAAGVYGSSTGDKLLSSTENMALMQILNGEDVANNNPKRIKFMELKEKDLGLVDTSYLKTTAGSTTNIVNPWGNSVRVAIDYDGDGTVKPDGASGSLPSINSPIAIWSVPALTFNSQTVKTNISW